MYVNELWLSNVNSLEHTNFNCVLIIIGRRKMNIQFVQFIFFFSVALIINNVQTTTKKKNNINQTIPKLFHFITFELLTNEKKRQKKKRKAISVISLILSDTCCYSSLRSAIQTVNSKKKRL